MRTSNGDAGNSSKAHGASPKEEDADRRVIASEVQAVRKLFTEAQRTMQCHRRCCDALRRLLSKHKSAWDEYLACLSRILVISKRDPGVERLVQFVILLTASGVGGNEEEGGQPRGGAQDDEHGATATALLDGTVKFLLTRSAAADKAVRFRCCQLLGGMTTEYSQRLNVPEEEIDRVVDVLLPRLQDKVAGVRVQAVAALRPFQFVLEEDEDEAVLQEDRVRAELMRAMMSDSSPDVRQAALVAVNKAVGMLDQLVLRTQDVKESVRKTAFRSLGEDVRTK